MSVNISCAFRSYTIRYPAKSIPKCFRFHLVLAMLNMPDANFGEVNCDRRRPLLLSSERTPTSEQSITNSFLSHVLSLRALLTMAETLRLGMLQTTRVNGLNQDDFESTQVWYEIFNVHRCLSFVTNQRNLTERRRFNAGNSFL